MKSACLILCMAVLTGCATFEQVATSSDTFAVCKAADVITTGYALHTGRFIEKNPLIAPLVSQGILPLLMISIAIWAVVDYLNDPVVSGTLNAVTCPVAAHNAFLILK